MALERHAPPATPPNAAVLTAWLRTLWNIAPQVARLPSDATPFITPDGLHLPMGHAEPGETMAAAAHAAAHTVYSRTGADATALRPTTRLLAGLLEDARIEWLAGREMPGLRRLWASQHTVRPEDGQDAETLMRRLARALADEHYADPHPWVAKGRRLCFLDHAQQVLALRQFDAVREAASWLGNDLGQMRLPLNARTYRPSPSYRDDNSWLWAPQSPPEPLAAAAIGRGDDTAGRASAVAQDASRHTYPEWDQRICRERPAWVTVTERAAPMSSHTDATPSTTDGTRRQLAVAARTLGHASPRPLHRQLEGDSVDLDALVRSWTGRRTGAEFDARVHLRQRRNTELTDVLLMLDTSASTADVLPTSGSTVLELTRTAARLCGEALHDAGHRCAIRAFSSAGRAAVTVQRVKEFDEPVDTACIARLAGLRPDASTRLGAAIRHGADLLRRDGSARTRHLALLTDGEAHDIDVHEPRYLGEDARHAVLEARRHGITVSCFSLHDADRVSLARIFGPGRHHRVRSPADLPAAVARLWR